jgi:transglutaminase-like putative cysteine protease
MSDAPDGPDTRRALLVVVCALGLVAASTAAPALASQTPLGGLDSPPAPSEIPDAIQEFADLQKLLGNTDDQPQIDAGTSAFGALSPGKSTDIGGPVSKKAQRESASPHFVAKSDGSTYWRTGAYTTYTGSGWERKTVNRVQPPRPPHSRPTGWASITLRKSATRLPTPWRPIDINYDCGDVIPCSQDFSLTTTGGVESSPPLREDATYQIQTVDPIEDRAVLRDVRVAGSVVATEYTTVDTTDRVSDLAADVVAGADNRYDAARAVEQYLESEKRYSLTDVPDPGSNIADQFLFEQSAGYCEYFASTMVVMLRSQNVPSRYVVGYKGGDRVGTNKYLVRGADAHAWVEVYFEDVGWVRFDPTPGSAREQARDALYDEDSKFRVSLNQSAIPGDTVTANVTTAGLPAQNVVVAVNGQRVGVTNTAGEVTFTVPYADNLTVTVRPENPDKVSLSVRGGGVPESTAAYGVPPPVRSAPQNTAAQENDADNGTSTEFDVEATVGFTFDEPVEPGAERTLEVRIAGKPFANASVSIAGVEQGRTGENGTLTVRIPADASGVIDVTATRDELTRTTTYPVDALSVAVSLSLGAPLPGTEATARVTAAGEPVVGAVVTVAGQRIGRTDADGTTVFQMPLARLPSVTAEASGKLTTATVGWVLPSAVAAAALVLSALAGLAVAARKRGVTVDAVVTAVQQLADEGLSYVVTSVAGVADAVDELAAEFREAAEEGWRGVLAWLASLPGRLEPPAVRAWVATAVAAARTEREDEPSATATPSARADDGEPADSSRLQAVWQRFVGVVGVERAATKTPGEVAREAIRRGFPERPVYAVTNAFRDAAYGGRPASSRLDRARKALAALRRRESTEDGGDE